MRHLWLRSKYNKICKYTTNRVPTTSAALVTAKYMTVALAVTALRSCLHKCLRYETHYHLGK